MDTISQLPLGFEPQSPKYSRADFIVGVSNQDAIATAENWASAELTQLTICGPDGSGKKHLAFIIARMTNLNLLVVDGRKIPADLGTAELVILMDCHRTKNVNALFTIVERCKVNGVRLILIGRGKPSEWSKGLKDLITRFEAMPRISLSDPDEDLLRAVIQKLFRDRQLRVDPAVCVYAADRLPRTFAAAQAFVAEADAESSRRRAPITKLLAGTVINNLSEGALGT